MRSPTRIEPGIEQLLRSAFTDGSADLLLAALGFLEGYDQATLKERHIQYYWTYLGDKAIETLNVPYAIWKKTL